MGDDDLADELSTADLLDAARTEMDRASEDLERVTRLLDDRTRRIEWLEALVDELLEVMAEPAVVLDAEGRIAAMSRGAEEQLPGARTALGRPAASVLPSQDGRELTKVSLPGDAILVVLGR